MTLEASRSQWDALTAWLEALPADQQEATLSISELEQLVGKPLSATAHTPAFWKSGPRRRLWGAGAAHRLRARLSHHHTAVGKSAVVPPLRVPELLFGCTSCAFTCASVAVLLEHRRCEHERWTVTH